MLYRHLIYESYGQLHSKMRFTILFCLALMKKEKSPFSPQNDWVGMLDQIHENDDHELTVLKFLHIWYLVFVITLLLEKPVVFLRKF